MTVTREQMQRELALLVGKIKNHSKRKRVEKATKKQLFYKYGIAL
jgi:hypothetical protein